MNKDEFRDNLLKAQNKSELLQIFKTEEQSYLDI
jgi:hypothetical protein